MLASDGASAQDDNRHGAVEPVDVLQVSGLFDHIVVKSIGDAIDRAVDQRARRSCSRSTRGAPSSVTTRWRRCCRRSPSATSDRCVGRPPGARLYGAPAQILAVADVTGMAPGARVGNVGAPPSSPTTIRSVPPPTR